VSSANIVKRTPISAEALARMSQRRLPVFR